MRKIILTAGVLLLSACHPSDQRVVTLLATNDIHGGVEATKLKDGKLVGGMDYFAGIVSSIRQGVAKKGGDRGGVLLLDAGDQFQGTLLSNYNEGQLVFATMNEAGYDVAIPGNHDYDFGPTGWLDDQVTPATQDQNPRGALLRLVGQAKFPLLSANTYLKASLVDSKGAPVGVEGVGCKPAKATAIDWSSAARPSFLQPYLIKTVAGLRVAVIGIDNPATPQVTTMANVTDYCFRDEVEAYLDTRKQLRGQADIFVLLVHDGDAGEDERFSKAFEKMIQTHDGVVDAIIAGHTHFINHLSINGVPVIQSSANGKMFGRIDLVWDETAHVVDHGQTRSYAGVEILHGDCAPAAKDFCQASGGVASYEGVPVVPNERVSALIAAARKDVAGIAERRLGDAPAAIEIDRIAESPLADALTDQLRELSHAEIALINTGGIRAPIKAGPVTYEDFFRVLPMNNHGVTVGPMTLDALLALLKRSVQTCGSYGALMQSGLKVTFTRDCKLPANAAQGLDPAARLLKVESLSGEVLYDQAAVTGAPQRSFVVATLDFLSGGGSGYSSFVGVPLIADLGILREALTDYLIKAPVRFSPTTDGRWTEAPSQE